MGTVETAIQKAIMEWAKHQPELYLWRNNTGATKTKRGAFIRYGHVGSGDIIGFMRPSGRFISIECKAPGETQSPEQVTFEQNVKDFGGYAMLTTTAAAAIETLEHMIACELGGHRADIG